MSTQLSTEGAHHEAVAKPPALCADGDPDAQERDAEGEFMRAVHERTALQGMQAESPPRVVDVEVHRAGVRMTGSTFNTGKAVLKEMDSRLPRGAKDKILNILWGDGEIPSIDWVRSQWPSPIVGEVEDTHVGAGCPNLHTCHSVFACRFLGLAVKEEVERVSVSLRGDGRQDEGKTPEMTACLRDDAVVSLQPHYSQIIMRF
jgi:hypothetical protein